MKSHLTKLINARMKSALDRDYVKKIIRQTGKSKGLLTCLTQAKEAVAFYDTKIALLKDFPRACMACEYANSVELNDSCMSCIDICKQMAEGDI